MSFLLSSPAQSRASFQSRYQSSFQLSMNDQNPFTPQSHRSIYAPQPRSPLRQSHQSNINMNTNIMSSPIRKQAAYDASHQSFLLSDPITPNENTPSTSPNNTLVSSTFPADKRKSSLTFQQKFHASSPREQLSARMRQAREGRRIASLNQGRNARNMERDGRGMTTLERIEYWNDLKGREEWLEREARSREIEAEDENEDLLDDMEREGHVEGEMDIEMGGNGGDVSGGEDILPERVEDEDLVYLVEGFEGHVDGAGGRGEESGYGKEEEFETGSFGSDEGYEEVFMELSSQQVMMDYS